MHKSKEDEPKSKDERKSRQLAAWLPQSQRAAKVEPLRDALRLLLLSSVLTGTAPASALIRNRFYGSLQLFLIIAIYAWLCLAVCLEYNQADGYISLQFFLNTVETCLYLPHVAFIFRLSLRWRHKLEALIDSIAEFDLLSGNNEDVNNVRLFVRRQLLVLLTIASLSITADTWFNRSEFFHGIRSLSVYVLPNVIIGTSLIQYYVLLHGVASRLAALNKSLALELQRTPFPRDVVQRLRLQHVRLMRFTKRINQTYGPSVVFVFVNSSINVSLNLFLLYKFVDDPTIFEIALLMYIIMWFILHLEKMYSILYFNHCVQRQQTYCLALLSSARGESEAVTESLKHFSLQLHMNVREHVVCGVIELNFKLITALSIFVVNVFIFLLQYDITFEALEKANKAKS